MVSFTAKPELLKYFCNNRIQTQACHVTGMHIQRIFVENQSSKILKKKVAIRP